jgi:hypothetical protein
MKPKLDASTTPEEKMQRFNTALGRILTVSKNGLNERIARDEHERRLRKNKPGPVPKS